MQPSEDIRVDCFLPDRFLMTLQVFAANDPIHGLLMLDRVRIGPAGPDETGITGPAWLYFGYLCERCRKTFLLPYWAGEKDDLPRAVQHSCHGGLDIDEVPREGIRQLANETAVQVMNKLALTQSQMVAIKSTDLIGYLIVHKFERALEAFWQQMVNSAIERAQGQGRQG